MIIETAIAAERAAPTLAVSISDGRLRARVLDAARKTGIAIVTDTIAAKVLVTDAVTPAPMPVVLIGTESALVEAMQSGVAGGLRPDFTAVRFERVLLAVAAGLTCFDLPPGKFAVAIQTSPDHSLADETDTTGAPLTPRETEVLAHMTTGASNKQIARALEISVHTVKFHVAQVIAKLGARGRTDAVARALSAGREMV